MPFLPKPASRRAFRPTAVKPSQLRTLLPLRGSAAQSGVQGYYPWSAFDFFHDEALDDVALFDVVVAIKADAALVARSHFLRVILEAL